MFSSPNSSDLCILRVSLIQATKIMDLSIQKELLKEWNNFGFKFVEKSDYPEILAHLRQNFYKDEPIHKMLGVTEARAADKDEKMMDILNLEHGSFYAFPLDNPTKVAALLIAWIQEKGKDLPYFEARSPLTITVRRCILELKGRYNIFEERHIDKYAEIFIISTDKQFRGKGLATEMYRKQIARFKEEGYPLVSSTFTNPFSMKLGDRLGFKQVARLDFDECKNEDGSSVFGDKGRDQYVIEAVLDLN